MQWDSVLREHMDQEEFGKSRGSDFIHCRDEDALFGESVYDN